MVQDTFLYTVTLFTFIVLFGLCYIRYAFTYFQCRKVPFASTPKFPFGNVGDVIAKQSPFFAKLWKYHKSCKRHGQKVVGFYLFMKPAILICDHRLLTNLFVEEPKELKILDEKLGELSDFFYKPWFSILQNITEDGEVNCSNIFTVYISKCLLKIFDLDNKFQHVIDRLSIKRSVFSNFNEVLEICYPNIGKIKRNSNYYHRKIIKNLILHRKKNDIRKDDVMQILIDFDCDLNEITSLALEVVKRLITALNSVWFCLFELGFNEEIQEELRGEIIRCKKLQQLNEFKNLPYLDTVISETLRKYPPKPVILFENPTLNIPGVPDGLPMFVGTFGMHHDLENYVNPELFDPDRFSEENKKFVEPLTYLPFGNSKSNNFLRLIMKMALIEIVSQFKFTIGKKTERPIKFNEVVFNLEPKGDLWLNLTSL